MDGVGAGLAPPAAGPRSDEAEEFLNEQQARLENVRHRLAEARGEVVRRGRVEAGRRGAIRGVERRAQQQAHEEEHTQQARAEKLAAATGDGDTPPSRPVAYTDPRPVVDSPQA